MVPVARRNCLDYSGMGVILYDLWATGTLCIICRRCLDTTLILRRALMLVRRGEQHQSSTVYELNRAVDICAGLLSFCKWRQAETQGEELTLLARYSIKPAMSSVEPERPSGTADLIISGDITTPDMSVVQGNTANFEQKFQERGCLVGIGQT